MECIKNGYFLRKSLEYKDIPASLTPYKSGDIVMAKVTPCFENGNIAIMSDIESGIGFGSSELFVFRATKVETKFLFYWLQNAGFVDIATASMTGMGGLKRVSPTVIKNALIGIPLIEEQRRITSFLDNKCAEIDALTADIQSQIDTMEQYKRSIVTDAVTKGLNPDAEMRDSRIHWVDKLPRYWDVIPSKYLFRNSDLRKRAGDVQLTASQNWGIIPQEEYMERTGAKIVFANQGLENWKHVEPDDFVISLRSFQGGLEMSSVTGCITWHYVVLKAARPIVPRFYKWLFKSDVYIAALQRTCNFIRDGQDLRYSNFSQVPLYIPPKDEQRQIADFLDEKCSEIDTIIAEKRAQKNVLDQYKKTLIFEYVTGKKEVTMT